MLYVFWKVAAGSVLGGRVVVEGRKYERISLGLLNYRVAHDTRVINDEGHRRVISPSQ